MDLITTHVNADFDALGSLVAARRLYPQSRLLLPGSPEKSVRDFLSLAKDSVPVESEKECSLADVERLILVDTRHKSRIGITAALVDKGIDVHIYDHHPRMSGDVVADKDVYDEVGATVTLLADIIKKRRMTLSPLEATIMLLGIYEETGSLTFRTTTRLDVDMVSFLLSQGANLAVVSSYLNRELSEEELSCLIELINSTEKAVVKGVDVAIVEMGAGSYIGELGMLIHKLMDIENISALFVFIRSGPNRVNIVARSKVANIDVNRILSHFGGGGHPSAASAKVESDNITAVKEKLLKVLRSNIKIRICAEDIMSRDIKTADINDRVDDTKKALLCEGVAAMPVSDKGKIIGVITLGALNKAIKHGFNHSRIKGYMSGGILTARERTPLHVLRRMMLEHDAGVLPVMKGKDVIGIIRRGDVLKKIHESFFAGSCAEKRRITLNISKKMAAIFPKDVMALMRLIGRLANKSRYTAFVVGGLVRDLMLGVGNLDLDIVIEGDAIAFGQALSRKLKGALIIHRRFGTCTVVTRKKLKIDLATARKEFYKAPAALPTVEFSSLKDDLMRRDFTINAMAISLNRKSFGQLIDFFGGEYDLHHGRIRVMHELSFIDDPTRIFRAVRFEQRFGFAIDKRTEYLILNAIEEEMFEKVQPQRIRDEAELILKEKEPLKALNRMNQLHELRFIHPKIHLDREAKELCRTADKVLSWYEKARFRKRPIERWLVYLMALLEPLTYDETLKFCDRFVFKRGERLRILSYKKYGRRIARLLSAERKLAPSKIYRILQPLSFEAALLIMAAAGSKRSRLRITDFLSKHNGIRLKIAGEDIKTLGLKPGPDFRTILKKVLYRKIDGRLRTKREELLYARELARQR